MGPLDHFPPLTCYRKRETSGNRIEPKRERDGRRPADFYLYGMKWVIMHKI